MVGILGQKCSRYRKEFNSKQFFLSWFTVTFIQARWGGRGGGGGVREALKVCETQVFKPNLQFGVGIIMLFLQGCTCFYLSSYAVSPLFLVSI